MAVPEVFEVRERDLPAPGRGEIGVKHHAIGLNFIDIYQRKGLYPISLPAILGAEAAGEITAVGDGVEGFKPGERVCYIGGGGAYAEEANVPAMMCAKIPDGVDSDIAAAIFLKGLTVEMLVRQVFVLKPEHACLVYAAAGGVGTLLCQWAHEIGARVIAVVGSEEKAKLARDNGASDAIIRTQSASISSEVRKLTDGHGVDVVYDSIGEATFEASLESLALRGHMVTFGNASGPVPPVSPLELSRRGSLTLTRPTLFHYATPDRLAKMAEALFEMAAKGVLQPAVTEFLTLDWIAGAQRFLESGKSAGSIILKP